MKSITVHTTGDFNNLYGFMERFKRVLKVSTLDKYGEMGVTALRNATPTESGKTKDSWFYTIEREDGILSISWHNSNVVDGVNIAIILQYGHATKNGHWVEGIDYINPALRGIFEDLAEDCWEEIIGTK